MYYGEKFIERKIEGNKVIHINEFKEFEGDYLGIVQDINDLITDDWEALIDNYGIQCDRTEDWYDLDCDMAYDALTLHIQEEREEYETEKEYLEDCRDWKTELALLEKAKGFTIYFHKEKDFYEK